MATSSLNWLKRIAIALGTVIALYLLAALGGSLLPANQNWQSPDDGIELFIETNGLHTGIIMPVWSDVHDWTPLIRPEHLADPSLYGSHILVGWGHEGVYRNTRLWTDLRPGDALSAILGSDDVLIHVYHLKYPQAYPYYRRRLKVSEAEYRKIATLIAARFLLDDHYRSQPSPGYGEQDLFYQAHGHYSAFYTCNNWTSDVLQQAGIRTGRWTPFQGGVMRWFSETAE
ncbi:TIGR02117 family protein [Parasphingorhabdus sp.]|uniref:TIGR02117 family protein n=1 Tax=Parasphingorhabdus sp. TaxID=2709688 RepID=UPI003A939555